MDAGLPDPADAERDQLFAQLARLRRLADDIVVHDEEPPAAGRFHLGDDLGGRAVVLTGAVEGGNRAEVALEVAAAGELDQRDVLIVLAGEQLAARAHPAQRPPAMAVVDRLQPAVPSVLD
jgi:hypothetical protein